VETTFRTANGTFVQRDVMPIASESDKHGSPDTGS
jgi:hypothetical protein